jgi:CheY-like chemotaxis protein
MNLVLNAAEAIGTTGAINIRTEVSDLSEEQAAAITVAAGRYLVLSVSDNGSGISSADQKDIFEPFYTKKTMGRSGTGLGLAVVWSCMQDHEGAVVVNSDEKQTTFSLYFPVGSESLSAPEETKNGKNIDAELRGNGECILVVDDEAQQRNVAIKILTELGYQATTVSSGESAIDYVTTHQVDLLLLDMVMTPGIDGLQTYQRIKEKCPPPKALIVSGFSESEKVKEALLLGVGGFLKKPYTVCQIATSVKKALS